ncbi:STAS domain-containing protein [Clostridium autoethanogenum]|uniref:Anti-sigma factor antagonist n=2 Tax=Clostridium autoethanogenum TaxID=84023 RepID=A0ABN4BKA4_9CLOT|nr:STAS domain-containing protein [Clostridium autoethanogenum]AGY76612.1 STAS domain-containing protein [Clostridium autoethanogenum DSM 10061]ALU36767.1 Anti-sigma-factor antagonist [Clostridium autoethanogenum DSM 10061]OVY50543.1 Anti-sigma-B factor antagonist [Clostridium autoethanogenum]
MKDLNIEIPENFAVDEADELRQKLNSLIDKGEKNFSLDFSKCTFIDSTGLGVLVSIYKKCKNMNGSFKLYSVRNADVMKIFNMTRLDKVFQIND